jgi:hypothetical protein
VFMGNGKARPEPGSGQGAGGESASVPVASVASRIEAELIAGMLRNNGLPAVVSADDAGAQQPQLQAQGVRVLVTPADEGLARRLIAESRDAASRDAESGDAASGDEA